MGFTWTEDRKVFIRNSFVAGNSYEGIAIEATKKYNDVLTKGAVAGFLWREGYRKGQGHPNKESSSSPKRVSYISGNRKRSKRKKVGVGTSMLEIGENQCRWILDDLKSDLGHAVCCGQKTKDGKSYCPLHSKLAYTGNSFNPSTGKMVARNV